jgi:phage-related minor tail protein
LAEITKVQQQIDAARLSMDLINTGGFSPELAKQAAELKVQVGLTGEQMSVLIPKLQELEQLKTPVQSLQESFRELADTVLDKVSNAFANAFTGIVNGTKSVSQAFKEMVGSILADFARMMAQKAAASLLGSLFGSLLGGGGGGGYTGNVFGAPVPGFTQPLALGGVLSGGNIMPFASGGVVKGPTLFPMAKGAGLMGEAGPEAIMPLKRGPDGKLGVAGGGANVNVNIINQAGAEVDTRQNGPDIDVIIRKAVASDIAGGGQIYRAIGQRFETSTRLTRR